MTDHIKVETSFVKSLLEGAAWEKAGLTLVEKKAATKEMKEADDEEEDLDPSGTKKELDQKESVEVHECPLCESVLDEELSDEAIFEHVAQIQEALKTLEEGTNRPGTPGGSTADLDLSDDEYDENDEEEDEDSVGRMGNHDEAKKKKGKKEVVMKKVKALKASAKGK